MFDSLPSPQFAEDLLFYMLQLWRKETEDRLTHYLLCPIAEDALGRFIPADDDSVQVLTDDGIVGGIDDCGEMETRIYRRFRGRVGGVRRGIYSRHVSRLVTPGDCILIGVIFLCSEVRCNLMGGVAASHCLAAISSTTICAILIESASAQRTRGLPFPFSSAESTRANFTAAISQRPQPRSPPTCLLFPSITLFPEARALLPRMAGPGRLQSRPRRSAAPCTQGSAR